jgi:hypothetical protein
MTLPPMAKVLLHIASVGGLGSRALAPLACACRRLRDQVGYNTRLSPQ